MINLILSSIIIYTNYVGIQAVTSYTSYVALILLKIYNSLFISYTSLKGDKALSGYITEFSSFNVFDEDILTPKADAEKESILQTDNLNNVEDNKDNKRKMVVTFNGEQGITKPQDIKLDLNLAEPYVEIMSVPKNSMFVAKQAKTYDEEKQVANKAPIDGISINNLNKSKKKVKKESKIKFLYKIKIADFYFKKTALSMIKRINNETNVKNPKIQKISDKKYRVYLGPFTNINSLQNSFNDIKILEFENIEIIKNDQNN